MRSRVLILSLLPGLLFTVAIRDVLADSMKPRTACERSLAPGIADLLGIHKAISQKAATPQQIADYQREYRKRRILVMRSRTPEERSYRFTELRDWLEDFQQKTPPPSEDYTSDPSVSWQEEVDVSELQSLLDEFSRKTNASTDVNYAGLVSSLGQRLNELLDQIYAVHSEIRADAPTADQKTALMEALTEIARARRFLENSINDIDSNASNQKIIDDAPIDASLALRLCLGSSAQDQIVYYLKLLDQVKDKNAKGDLVSRLDQIRRSFKEALAVGRPFDPSSRFRAWIHRLESVLYEQDIHGA